MRAGVAITLVLDHEGEPAVPIFQRTVTLRPHDGEAPETAALRELEEELGLHAEPAEVLGMLDDFDTVSGFTITPVVVWSGAPATELRPSPDEVEQLFVIPVSMLRAAVAGAGRGPDFSLNLPLVEVFAPTAAMLYQFSEVALDGRTVRVNDFFQPPWTHR
jgi:8-oxo-dGTP pyrophosphatase MutT (NUDIX family)